MSPRDAADLEWPLGEGMQVGALQPFWIAMIISCWSVKLLKLPSVTLTHICRTNSHNWWAKGLPGVGVVKICYDSDSSGWKNPSDSDSSTPTPQPCQKVTKKHAYKQGRNEVKWRPGQEASLEPHVRIWVISEASLLYCRKYFWHCWDFRRAPQWFGTPITIWRLGNCAPLAKPLPYKPSVMFSWQQHWIKFVQRLGKSQLPIVFWTWRSRCLKTHLFPNRNEHQSTCKILRVPPASSCTLEKFNNVCK